MYLGDFRVREVNDRDEQRLDEVTYLLPAPLLPRIPRTHRIGRGAPDDTPPRLAYVWDTHDLETRRYYPRYELTDADTRLGGFRTTSPRRSNSDGGWGTSEEDRTERAGKENDVPMQAAHLPSDPEATVSID